MSLLLCGDPHGRFDHIIDAARHYASSAVVLLGDLEPLAMLEEVLGPIAHRVWWIPGNHDAGNVTAIERTWGSGLADRNLHGRVAEVAGLSIAGLGNVFRSTVWMPRGSGGGKPSAGRFQSREEHALATPRQDRYCHGPHFRHWGTIYPREFYRLQGHRADILVTHEAGSCHPHGFAVIDELARSLGVKLHAHGHHHDARWQREDQQPVWEKLGFASIGVGRRGITAVAPDSSFEVLVPGELDALDGLDGLPAPSKADMPGGTRASTRGGE